MQTLDKIESWIAARPAPIRWPLYATFVVVVFVGYCLSLGINGRRRR